MRGFVSLPTIEGLLTRQMLHRGELMDSEVPEQVTHQIC